MRWDEMTGVNIIITIKLRIIRIARVITIIIRMRMRLRER